MFINDLLFYLVGVSTCLLTATVAREVIVDGELAGLNQFPYQVSVQIHGHGYECGGGIIGHEFILTAAHCVLNRERQFINPHISIHAGTINYYRTQPPAVTVKVRTIFFPTEYRPEINYNFGDIALLKVDSLELSNSTNLRKLDLPEHNYYGGVAKIAGYGWHTNEVVGRRIVGNDDGQLRYALARIHFQDECALYYPRRTLQHSKHFCATVMQSRVGQQPPSTCIGDAGGPLVHNGVVIGILSRIPHFCDEQNFPAVYTRVAHYRRMIVSAMLGIDYPHMNLTHAFP